MKHLVIIAIDHSEASAFADWLNSQGHVASVGESTASYVDGVWTAQDERPNEIMHGLWAEYCREATQ